MTQASVATIELAAACKGREFDEEVDRRLDFLSRPSVHLSYDWQCKLFPPEFPLDELGPRGHRFASRYVMRKLDLGRFNYGELENHPSRDVLILPPSQLSMLVNGIGVVIVGDPVRRCVSKADVDYYRSALGEQVYRFAISVAPLLIQDVERPMIPMQREALIDEAYAYGYSILQRACEHPSDEGWRRLCIKLPSCPEHEPFIPRSLSDPAAALRLALRVLTELRT